MKITLILFLNLLTIICFSQEGKDLDSNDIAELKKKHWLIIFDDYIYSQYNIKNKHDYSNQKLHKLPDELIADSNIDYLDLGNHQIKRFYKKSKILKDKKIKIYRTGEIKNIDDLPNFDYLPDLEILDLRFSGYIDIVPKVLNCSHLKAIIPNMYCFEDTLVFQLDSLEYLDCNLRNSVFGIPVKLIKHNTIKGLQFYITPQWSFDKDLYQLKKLEFLSLIISEKDSLEFDFYQFPNLKRIDLFSTDLSNISEDLYRLQNLQNLNIFCHNFSIQQQNFIISKLPNTKVFFGQGEYDILKEQIYKLPWPSIRSCLKELEKIRKKQKN